MKLISIDPGKITGYAVFQNERLKQVGLIYFDPTTNTLRTETWRDFEFRPDKVIIELPQIYNQRLWKGDPNDLVTVAFIAGCLTKLYSNSLTEIQTIRPHDWKGNRPKEIDHALTYSRLTADEKEIIEREEIPKTKLHNVLDAVGIGLWKLGRR